LAAQIIQDFGAGPLFLWPLLRAGEDSNAGSGNPIEIQVLITGEIIFGLGWAVRRATKAPAIGE
jgi:hypothetical protein